MLGATLCEMLNLTFDVYATGGSNFEGQHSKYLCFDLLNEDYSKLIEWSKPDFIIHCAAITNGSFCEKNPFECFKVNSFSVKSLIDYCGEDVKFIYISTDAVFSYKQSFTNELDFTKPENNYGKSKELGEFFLMNSKIKNYLIIRTTIVGLNKNISKFSFIDWILNSVLGNKKIGLFEDVKFCPISIWDLSDEIMFLMNSNNINSETLHIAGEVCTKYEFGKELVSELNMSSDLIERSSIQNFKDRAKRSNDQTIDSSLYQKKYKRKLPNIKNTIKKIKKYYEK